MAKHTLEDFKKNSTVLGLTFAVVAVIWYLLLLIGWGQQWVDFSLSAKLLALPVSVLPFDLTNVVIGVVIAFVEGYVLGWLLTWAWQKVYFK